MSLHGITHNQWLFEIEIGQEITLTLDNNEFLLLLFFYNDLLIYFFLLIKNIFNIKIISRKNIL